MDSNQENLKNPASWTKTKTAKKTICYLVFVNTSKLIVREYILVLSKWLQSSRRGDFSRAGCWLLAELSRAPRLPSRVVRAPPPLSSTRQKRGGINIKRAIWGICNKFDCCDRSVADRRGAANHSCYLLLPSSRLIGHKVFLHEVVTGLLFFLFD